MQAWSPNIELFLLSNCLKMSIKQGETNYIHKYISTYLMYIHTCRRNVYVEPCPSLLLPRTKRVCHFISLSMHAVARISTLKHIYVPHINTYFWMHVCSKEKLYFFSLLLSFPQCTWSLVACVCASSSCLFKSATCLSTTCRTHVCWGRVNRVSEGDLWTRESEKRERERERVCVSEKEWVREGEGEEGEREEDGRWLSVPSSYT